MESELNDGQSGAGRLEYRHPQKIYAERYGVALRTIKRWVAHGVARHDLCPLDDVEGMLPWWSRTMVQVAPSGLQAAVIEHRKLGGSPAPQQLAPAASMLELPVTTQQAPAPPEAPGKIEIDEESLGLEHLLRRLQETEQRLSHKATEPGQAKPWLDTAARIGPVQKLIREEMEKMGKLIPREAAAAAIMEFHGPIERGIRGMYRTFCETTGIPHSIENESAWNAALDQLFKRFGEDLFA